MQDSIHPNQREAIEKLIMALIACELEAHVVQYHTSPSGLVPSPLPAAPSEVQVQRPLRRVPDGPVPRPVRRRGMIRTP